LINLVISPSQQNFNKCAIEDSEADHMNLIGQALYDILKNYSQLNLLLIPRMSEDDGSNLRNAIAMSNDFIANNGGNGFHICLHSDAGAYATGASGLYFSEAGKAFMLPIMRAMENLTPWNDIGLRYRNNLSELKRTIAVAGLLEISFHDNINEAQWIHDNIGNIAVAIANGILKALDIQRTIGIVEAIQILNASKVMQSPEYWVERCVKEDVTVSGEHLQKLLINMASRLSPY
jgi:hypothetical protein